MIESKKMDVNDSPSHMSELPLRKGLVNPFFLARECFPPFLPECSTDFHCKQTGLSFLVSTSRDVIDSRQIDKATFSLCQLNRIEWLCVLNRNNQYSVPQ